MQSFSIWKIMISSSIVFCGRGKQEISGRGWWTAPRQLETALSQQTNKPYLLRFSTSYFLLFQVDCKNQEEVSDLSWVISTASQKNITDGFCPFLQLWMSPSYLIEWKRVPLVTPDAYLIFVIFLTQAKFLENKIYTEKCQFLPIFRQFLPIYT